MDYAKTPHEYGAIYFHAGAQHDPGWSHALALEVGAPGSVSASGLYAVALRSAGGASELPLVVTGASPVEVLVSLPTFSYQAAAGAKDAAGATPLISPLTVRTGRLRDQPDIGNDLALLRWLELQGVTHDVTCDHHVHHVGVDALRGYAVVVTGSHPAYASGTTLDALETYLRQGGGLLYLGGGGFR